jgi:hypothetical protein
MPKRVSPKDRLLAEDLMRTWHACHESDLLLREPSFPAFNAAVTVILTSLGMEWDVGHGYVFPWTDTVNGPFPMTGTTVSGPKTGGTAFDECQQKTIRALKKLAEDWPKSLGLVLHTDGGSSVSVVDLSTEAARRLFAEDPASLPSVHKVSLPWEACD